MAHSISIRPDETVVEVMPEGSLEVLSQQEVRRLRSTSESGQHEILRRCALAVLNVGGQSDDTREILERYRSFDIRVVEQDRGIKLALTDAPAEAFVDGKMIRGIRELLFAVLRDVVFISHEVTRGEQFDLQSSDGITNAIFHILRHAGVVRTPAEPNLVVCWGGHAIGREEYDYSKQVGYELGLRSLNVCTGCGGGAMKGPMKGAAVGHAKQRVSLGRYVGITEPGIIAAESPNPIVNQLVIMPDMEKRLEAFLRVAHAIVIFPGGVGTAEELLFLLGVLINPRNYEIPLPVILTGPRSSEAYFEGLHAFIGATVGRRAQQRYQISLGDPATVARLIKRGLSEVRDYRQSQHDAYYFNWRLHLELPFQMPFLTTHESMRELRLYRSLEPHELAANLRRAFSGLVTGNVKDAGIRAIESRGPFELRGDAQIMGELDVLLASFVKQKRMRLSGRQYDPCYRIVV